jgi:hypothetical protein
MEPIQVSDLDYWFGKGEAKKQVLFDINLIDKKQFLINRRQWIINELPNHIK